MEMRKMEELKMKLMRDLEAASDKGALTSNDVSYIKNLTGSIKNLCKIMEYEEEGASNAGYSGRHYVRGHYSRDAYADRSYRDSSYAGGYSENSYRDMKDMLDREYSQARDEKERETIRRMMERMK